MSDQTEGMGKKNSQLHNSKRLSSACEHKGRQYKALPFFDEKQETHIQYIRYTYIHFSTRIGEGVY